MSLVYIVVRGGLGNQLFQSAFGTALTHRFAAEVRYLTDFFKIDHFRRRLLMERLTGLNPAFAPPGEASGAPVFGERGLDEAAISDILARHPVVIFDGWWQHERFFLGQDAAIRTAFRLDVEPDLAERGRQLRATGAIGVHVRRSEYGQMGLAKVDYYTAAIERIRRERGDRPCVFFTDEPNFCTAVFQHLPGYGLVSGDQADPLDDFHLLSRCAHFVVANSSFSWWAAWLGADADAIVYAPAPWCVYEDSDPILPRWRRVEQAVQAQ